jgi:hypothetical protein
VQDVLSYLNVQNVGLRQIPQLYCADGNASRKAGRFETTCALRASK